MAESFGYGFGANVVETVTASIANTETRVIGATCSANRIKVGTTVRCRIAGLLNNTTSASTSVWRLRMGPTTLTGPIVASWSNIIGIVARVDCPFVVDVHMVCLTAGASGTAWGVIAVNCNTATVLGIVTSQTTAAVTVDTTAALQVEVTCISGAATTTWNCITRSLEFLNT